MLFRSSNLAKNDEKSFVIFHFHVQGIAHFVGKCGNCEKNGEMEEVAAANLLTETEKSAEIREGYE